MRGVEVDVAGVFGARRREIHFRLGDAGFVDASDEQTLAEPVLCLATHNFRGPDFGVIFVPLADPALWRYGGGVGDEHEGIEIGD